MIEYKTPDQIRAQRRAGLVVAQIHQALRELVAPGVTTAELDAVAKEVLDSAGAVSNFYGYHGFPAHICASVNDVIVHGIPSDEPLAPGDLVSLDCGAILDGWHADAAFSMVVPGDDAATGLCEVTERAMWVGIAAFARGKRIGDIGNAIDDYVSDLPDAPDILLDYVGHGIGTTMHQEPEVVHFRSGERTPKIKPGMVICIEPMLTAGDQANYVAEDGWTVRTSDGSLAAHWEHMVARHKAGIWVLTAPDGGAAGLAPFGITPVPL